MAEVRFSGLPEPCQVGPAVLRPVSISNLLLPSCTVCKRVNARYHLCAQGHSFCPDCVPPLMYSRSRWCLTCGRHVDFTEESLPRYALQEMPFYCACGFKGTLPQIKEHLVHKAFPQQCYGQAVEDVENRQEATIIDRSQAQSGLTREFEKIWQTLESQKEMISMLLENLCRIETVCDVLAGNQQILCFNFGDVLRRSQPEQTTVVDGVPLRIQVLVVGLEDEPFLCVSVAGAALDGNDTQWPLKLQISLSIVDLQGRIVISQDILTFKDGKYTDPSFEDPLESSSSTGHCLFMRVGSVLECYPPPYRDYLVLSVSVTRMDVNHLPSH